MGAVNTHLPTRRLYRVSEFALISGMPQQTIRSQLRDGRLRGFKVGKGRGRWRVVAGEDGLGVRDAPE